MTHRVVFWLLVAMLGVAWRTNSAQTFVAFGLTNSTIGTATYSSNFFLGFIVGDLGEDGMDGLSIDLGEADSGVFVNPITDMDPPNGSFMAGNLYGSVNGETNRLISYMRCVAAEDGYHPVEIDFSSLGPTHVTFQAFRSGTLVAQTDPQPGHMVVYGDYFTPYYPRVNPFWRLSDGSIGALIEFSEPAAISLPNLDADVSADRIFIRADDPTNTVDFASRLDITARLPYFQIDDMRLGVFNRPHRALGDAHLHARPGSLRIANLGRNPEDGLAIELNAAVRFDAAFTPIQLNSNGILTFLSMGSGPQGTNEAVGSARLARVGESLDLTAHLGSASNLLVAVYSNGVPTGTAAGTNAIVPSTAAVTGYELHSRIAHEKAGVVFHLGQTVPVTLPGQPVIVGDEIRFIGEGGLGLLRMLALNSAGMDEFTIVSETEHALPIPRLQIVRSGNDVELSWEDPYRAFGVEYTDTLGEGFYPANIVPSYVGDRATIIWQNHPATPLSTLFFRLSTTPIELPTEE